MQDVEGLSRLFLYNSADLLSRSIICKLRSELCYPRKKELTPKPILHQTGNSYNRCGLMKLLTIFARMRQLRV